MKNSNGMVEMLTVKDIQQHLCLSKNIVYQLVQMDSFPKIKIGNSYRIPKDKYEKWIEQNIRREIIIQPVKI